MVASEYREREAGVVGPAFNLVTGTSGDFGRNSFAVARVLPEFAQLFTRDALERVVDSKLMRYPYMLLVQESQPLPIERFVETRQVGSVEVKGYVVPERVWECVADGATLMLHAVEHWHAAVREIAAALEPLTGATVRASVFLTPPGARGLSLHRDNRHVVAIQMEGVKTWEIYPAPEDEQWCDGRIEDPEGEPRPVALVPGDVLGMVRGSPHGATANDQTTLHLTFSFEAPSLRERLRALAYEALEDVPDKAVLSRHDPRLHEHLDALLERMRAAAGT